MKYDLAIVRHRQVVALSVGTGKTVARRFPTGTAASVASGRGPVAEAGQGAAAIGECGAVHCTGLRKHGYHTSIPY